MLAKVVLSVAVLVAVQAVVRRDTAVLAPAQFGGFKPNCHAIAGGCKCEVDYGHGVEEREFTDDTDCKVPVEMQTAENKKAVNAEIKAKYGAFKENCFPKPSGGCKCNVDYGHGEEVAEFAEDKECKVSVEAETVQHKKELNEEIKEKYGDFKENCFPKPSGGCKCNEKDASGSEVVATYNADSQCKVLVPHSRDKREARDTTFDTRTQQQNVGRARTQTKDIDRPSQNVRDPVRERAQTNYAAVVKELNEKFKGLKEGCYPRPKGCLCVVGRTAEGRDITERRMKDADCKCREGERGPGCPAA